MHAACLLFFLLVSSAAQATSFAISAPHSQTILRVSPEEVSRIATRFGAVRGVMPAGQHRCKHSEAKKSEALALDASLSRYFLKWGGQAANEAYRAGVMLGTQRAKVTLKQTGHPDGQEFCRQFSGGLEKDLRFIQAYIQNPPPIELEAMSLERLFQL